MATTPSRRSARFRARFRRFLPLWDRGVGVASRMFLSILLFLSWWVYRSEEKRGRGP